VQQWLFASYPSRACRGGRMTFDMSDVFLGEPERLRARLADKVVLVGRLFRR